MRAPSKGVISYVDVDSGRVIVEDRGVVPFPPEAGDYAAESVGPLRQDLRPIEISQPEGPSFDVDGHAIRWQKWQFRISSAIHTLGNCEYEFFWYFYLDGTIQMEVKLTGIVGVSAVADGRGSDTAPLVAPSLTSPIHQQLFCFRLDFDLEGERNSVYEIDVEPLAGTPCTVGGQALRATISGSRRMLPTSSTAPRARSRTSTRAALARRTGRSCQSSTADSRCFPLGSSSATRRSTSHLRTPKSHCSS